MLKEISGGISRRKEEEEEKKTKESTLSRGRRFARGRVRLGVITCEDAGLEEALGSVLFVNKLCVEVGLGQLLQEEGGSGGELCFGVRGIEDERLVLESRRDISQKCPKKTKIIPAFRTHSPPSILRATYMPTAAIMLGFARRKR
jgi:hypothetical protein